MKWIFIIILLLTPTFSHADDCTKKEISGKALEYHYGDNFYLVIATTQTRVFIELRSYNSDKLIQDIVLSSRYMPPEFELKDVVLDNDLEFLVRTRGGGTGFAETHLGIYALIKNKIKRIGDFVIESNSTSAEEPIKEDTLYAKVEFHAKNKILYTYKRVSTEGIKTQTDNGSKAFSFNPKLTKFEINP